MTRVKDASKMTQVKDAIQQASRIQAVFEAISGARGGRAKGTISERFSRRFQAGAGGEDQKKGIF